MRDPVTRVRVTVEAVVCRVSCAVQTDCPLPVVAGVVPADDVLHGSQCLKNQCHHVRSPCAGVVLVLCCVTDWAAVAQMMRAMVMNPIMSGLLCCVIGCVPGRWWSSMTDMVLFVMRGD